MRGTTKCKVCQRSASYAFSLNVDIVVDGFEEIDVFRCLNCGLLFVGNEISDSQLAALYSVDYEPYYSEIETANETKVSSAIADLRHLLVENASLLDLGCGNGLFLESLRGDFPRIRVAGHELPGRNFAACKEKGLEVYTGSLEALPRNFDVCSMLDVLEHLPDPIEVLDEVHDLLAPGGYVYIRTPRRCVWDTLAARAMEIPQLRPAAGTWIRIRLSWAHLQLWSDSALCIALARAGFRIVHVRSELDLSGPFDRYVQLALGTRYKPGTFGTSMIRQLARMLIVDLGLVRNKAVVLAQAN